MRIPFIILGSLLLLSSLVVGQTYTISTLAGGGLPVNIPGTTALMGQAPGVAVDANGNVFIASSSLHIVLRLDAATGSMAPRRRRWSATAAAASSGGASGTIVGGGLRLDGMPQGETRATV